MHPKPFSSKYVTHGLKYEPIALQQYEKFMFNRKTPVAVLKSGFVVSKSCPVLGASPDAKVVDFGCSLGGQGGQVVSASDLQSGGPRFESRSGHLLDLCSVVPSSNSRPRL